VQATEVLAVWRACRAAGIEIWIDGGWCVDALLGRQTREHDDLDIAVRRRDAARLRESLAVLDYALDPDGATEANFVLRRHDGDAAVDVHVVDGIGYPPDSFTGIGVIDGEHVRCVSPERMFQFKTAYPPAAKDVADVRALCERFGFPVPAAYHVEV
jgi:lincosamide nucleotidyltransferase A/C/D/E